ncbi:MAG: Gfo/Idh/MocA family oxidoreductase [Clostridia bacterium]|nr:Gfo/Idh/MocA family oxidoreductase [Clostridia bacterium]
MFRIGIIGSENSHAAAFSKIFNTTDLYPDIKVVAIYGEDRAASERIYKEYGVERLCDHPSEMEGMVDAIMITSRHGGLHFKYAKPFIEKGLPAFIDKPVTCNPMEALDLVRCASSGKAPFMGGSSTRLVPDTLRFKQAAEKAMQNGTLVGGHVWAPVNMMNPYGDFWFYASHLVEIALTIFGYHPFEVGAFRTDSGVTALLNYGRFAVHMTFSEGNYNYGATVIADEVTTGNIDISDCYSYECEEYANMLRTGEMPQNAHDFVEAVCVMHAIEESFTTGKRVRIVNVRA